MRKVWIISIVIAIVASGAAYYFYSELRSLKQNPGEANREEAQKLVALISELMILPEGEEPTVATVSDPKLLKDKPFFANAKAGYKVLIFTKAKKAILYDPSTHRIVDVAPIDIGGPLEKR